MVSINDFRSQVGEGVRGGRKQARAIVKAQIAAAVKSGRISPLTAARMRAGLTQAQLAARLDRSQPQIAKWERPDSFEAISLGNLRQVAAALGIELAVLTGNLE
jgi:hypothetical protein